MELGIFSRKEGNGVYLFKKTSVTEGEDAGLGFYATSGSPDHEGEELTADDKIVQYPLAKAEPKEKLGPLTPESMVS